MQQKHCWIVGDVFPALLLASRGRIHSFIHSVMFTVYSHDTWFILLQETVSKLLSRHFKEDKTRRESGSRVLLNPM